jgi:hypothetical protein
VADDGFTHHLTFHFEGDASWTADHFATPFSDDEDLPDGHFVISAENGFFCVHDYNAQKDRLMRRMELRQDEVRGNVDAKRTRDEDDTEKLPPKRHGSLLPPASPSADPREPWHPYHPPLREQTTPQSHFIYYLSHGDVAPLEQLKKDGVVWRCRRGQVVDRLSGKTVPGDGETRDLKVSNQSLGMCIVRFLNCELRLIFSPIETDIREICADAAVSALECSTVLQGLAKLLVETSATTRSRLPKCVTLHFVGLIEGARSYPSSLDVASPNS